MKYNYIKRLLDVIFATIMIVFFLPVFLLIIMIVMLESKGGAFFVQTRAGRNGVPFSIYKFRSMSIEAPSNIATRDAKDASMITRSGAFLRRTGLDELPQLFNIIKGEMSFIGPRPVILKEEDLLYLRKKYGADKCVPGITGWAQANGRDEIDIEEKAYMDGVYAKNFGVKMDWRCIVKTCEIIITGEGHREGYHGSDVEKIKLSSLSKNRKKTKNFFSIRKKVAR